MRHFARRGASALLVLAGALVAVTCAAAGPGVSTTTPFTYGGTNPCTGEEFMGDGTLGEGLVYESLIRYPNVTWGPGKFQGVDSQRTLQWTSDCTCWRAQGQFAPLFL